MNQSPKFQNHLEFQKELKIKISEFTLKNKAKDVSAHYVKAFFVLAWAWLSYASLYVLESPFALISMCILTGIAHTGVGFNIFHDAVHGGFSHSKKINRFLAFLTCSILGVSSFLWRYKHNYLHHQFTNIEHWDDDLDTRGALRLSPYQEKLSKYRFQHYYAPFIYGMTSLEWIFVKDFKQYFSRQMGPHQIPALKPLDHLEFWVCKIVYFTFYVFLPFCYFDLIPFILGFVLFHFSFSLAMASVFQLAHVMPQTLYANHQNTYDDRYFHQLQTTVNFGAKSKFLRFYAGGLHYQIEHHFFPKISHMHYPALSKIIKELALKYQQPYHSYDNYAGALKAHFQTLKKLALN